MSFFYLFAVLGEFHRTNSFGQSRLSMCAPRNVTVAKPVLDNMRRPAYFVKARGNPLRSCTPSDFPKICAALYLGAVNTWFRGSKQRLPTNTKHLMRS